MERFFRCIGLEEDKAFNWTKSFSVGKVYELIKDNKDGIIVLKKGKKQYCVDADQFREVEPICTTSSGECIFTEEQMNEHLEILWSSIQKQHNEQLKFNWFIFIGEEPKERIGNAVPISDEDLEEFEKIVHKDGSISYNANDKYYIPGVLIIDINTGLFHVIDKVSDTKKAKLKLSIYEEEKQPPKHLNWAEEQINNVIQYWT